MQLSIGTVDSMCFPWQQQSVVFSEVVWRGDV